MSEQQGHPSVGNVRLEFAGWSSLRLFVSDVDGTLTDGGMYYSENGEVMKRFNTRDAAGMSRLRLHGMILALLTTENSPIVLARARKLDIQHVYVGVDDKVVLLENVLKELRLTWEQVVFVGDDLNDLPALKRAGFSACPCDAAPEVAKHVTYVCKRAGGQGAVREVCDLINRALNEPNRHAPTSSHGD